MSTPLLQIDAFTTEPFRGNPAAVCILGQGHGKSDDWMQALAAEMNLSETAFVAPHENPLKRAWRLRWFTPAVEVDLCGHATLATAHALWTEGYLRPNEEARFHTRSGVLSCSRTINGRITMNFPARQTEAAPAPDGLLEALGIDEAVFVGKNVDDFVVEVKTAETVRTLTPNFHLLYSLPARGVSVTAPSDDPQYSFISRFFAPGSGIDEDPVTGSAHCALTPYWASKLNTNKMTAYQASARGGVIHVELVDERVNLTGNAVTVLRGNLL